MRMSQIVRNFVPLNGLLSINHNENTQAETSAARLCEAAPPTRNI